jgi:hypothetical protein
MWCLWWTKQHWGRFYLSTSVSPANHDSTNFSIIIINQGWHNRPISGCGTEWTQMDSTPPLYKFFNFYMYGHIYMLTLLINKDENKKKRSHVNTNWLPERSFMYHTTDFCKISPKNLYRCFEILNILKPKINTRMMIIQIIKMECNILLPFHFLTVNVHSVYDQKIPKIQYIISAILFLL